jgi:hypothetical protein
MPRPSAPSGRHAVGAGTLWSVDRVSRGTARLARRRAKARPGAAMLTALGTLAAIVATGGLVLASHDGRAATPLGPTPVIAVPHGKTRQLTNPGDPGEVALPAKLIIPAIGVHTTLVRLGRTAGGALQVPATTSAAGWYTGSPRPGALGAAVIAGHVDSASGPGVFFRLRLLRPGELILVRRADRSLAAFRVFAVRQFAKSRFPTAAVYGPVPAAELRVVTCGGTFDAATGHYLGNEIVFAVAVSWRHLAGPARLARHRG